jgi:hypothetical protein
MLDRETLNEMGLSIEHTVVVNDLTFFMDTADELEAFVLGYMEGRASVSEDAAPPPVAGDDVYADEDVVFTSDTSDWVYFS